MREWWGSGGFWRVAPERYPVGCGAEEAEGSGGGGDARWLPVPGKLIFFLRHCYSLRATLSDPVNFRPVKLVHTVNHKTDFKGPKVAVFLFTRGGRGILLSSIKVPPPHPSKKENSSLIILQSLKHDTHWITPISMYDF